jgi:hypothetical protein
MRGDRVVILLVIVGQADVYVEPSGSFIRIDTALGLPNCWMIGSP